MATDYGNKSIVTDGLVFCVDPANKQSYPRTGTTATDIINNIAGTLTGAGGSNNTPQWENTNGGVFDFDGTDDYIDFDDPSILSFGNGSTNSPFSISQWWYMDSAAGFRGAQKFANSGENGEYRLNTVGSGILKFSLLDSNLSNRIGIQSSDDLSSYENTWINVVGTYSGTAFHSGLKIYLNNSILSTSSDNAGEYVAMHNTSEPFKIGRLSTAYANGKISCTQIYNKELSASEVLQNYNALKSRFE